MFGVKKFRVLCHADALPDGPICTLQPTSEILECLLNAHFLDQHIPSSSLS